MRMLLNFYYTDLIHVMSHKNICVGVNLCMLLNFVICVIYKIYKIKSLTGLQYYDICDCL